MLEVNKIYCIDALEGLKQLDDESIDLVVTDPPYNVLRSNKNLEKADWDHFKTLDDFLLFTKKWMGECYRVLKKNSVLYTFWSQKYMKEFWNLEQPFAIKRMIIWHHPNCTKGFNSREYLWTYDPIFYCIKGKGHKFNGSFLQKDNVDVFKFATPQTNYKKDKQVHFLQKPLELVKKLIKNSSDEGDLVLDPFMGSGTTAIACLELNRRFIGFEINPDYVEMAYRRIEPYLKQTRLEVVE